MPLDSPSRTLLREAAYEALRDAIVRGDLPPGARLRDADLADRMGLSRAPVREALARLVSDGLVQTKPQSYTRVAPLVLEAVRDAAEVVRAMHEIATRAAVPRLTAEDLLQMREANRRFAAAVRSGDADAAMAADDALHGALITRSGNRAVASTVERYTPLLRRLERLQFTRSTARRSVATHDQLIAACSAGDVAAAVAVTSDIWRSLENQAGLAPSVHEKGP